MILEAAGRMAILPRRICLQSKGARWRRVYLAISFSRRSSCPDLLERVPGILSKPRCASGYLRLERGLKPAGQAPSHRYLLLRDPPPKSRCERPDRAMSRSPSGSDVSRRGDRLPSDRETTRFQI